MNSLRYFFSCLVRVRAGKRTASDTRLTATKNGNKHENVGNIRENINTRESLDDFNWVDKIGNQKMIAIRVLNKFPGSKIIPRKNPVMNSNRDPRIRITTLRTIMLM